jgi:hypothetical protein
LVQINLTERQAENLKDIVDNWIDGYDEATVQVMLDRSFDEPEDMLRAADSIREQHRDAVDIRQQLWIAIRQTEGDICG